MALAAPFVGRADQLDDLEQALGHARRGDPQLVLIDADPGLGKSALLRAFTTTHPELRGLTWTGDETERELPYGMLGYLLDQPTRWPDPFAAGSIALGHLSDLLEHGPVLLALDDLPFADQPSLTALNFLIRRLRHDPVLLVATARTKELPALPASLLRRAEDAGTRLTLTGLTPDEVWNLATALAPADGAQQPRLTRQAAARLAGHTRGNPLHLKALLAEVPVADLEALDRPIPAPASFTQLVLADLASATPVAQQLAVAAAVLGERTPLGQAARVARLDAERALAAAEELCRLRLLHTDGTSDLLRFDHPLVRAAVYCDLGPATRAAQHTRAAQVLAELGDEATVLRHRVSAATAPDPDVAAAAEAASDRARLAGDLDTAADRMRTAHRLTPPGPEADQRLLAAADLLLAGGDAAAAQRYADQLAALPPTGRSLATRARLAWLTGHADQALSLGEQAWDLSDDLRPDQRDMLAAMLTQLEILRSNGARAQSWARRALAGGRLDPLTASHTRAQLALALATSGRLHEGLRALDDLPSDPRAVPAERHAELAARGHLLSWEGGATAAAEDQVIVGWSTGHGESQPFRFTASGGLAECLFRLGDWGRSQAVAEQVLSLAQDIDQAWLLGFLHYVAALVPSATGDWATAEHHVAGVYAAAARLGDHATAACGCDTEVFLATSRGDPARVVAAADRLRDIPPDAPSRELGMFWWPVHLVAALVALDRLDDAARELDRIRSVARPGDRRCGLGIARVAGQLAAARGHLEEARAAFTAAVDDPEGVGDVLERALAHAAYGQFLRRRGERRHATDQLLEARDRLTALGARPFLAGVENELRACGVDPLTPDHGPAERLARLTPQERVVASLVCSGQTNREVARELVLSVKTVGYHLANVYTKLGVHNRVQLVAALGAQPDHPLAP